MGPYTQNQMRTLTMLRWMFPLAVVVLWMGCGAQPDSETSSSSPPSEEALIILARADAVDGTEDQVVSKCLTCALGMSGSEDHISNYGPYALHLCSAGCKKRFDSDPEDMVLTASVPEPSE